MFEQPEILEHDADAPAHAGQLVGVERRRVLVENRDAAARRLERQQHQPEQGRLAGARGAGQELKALRRDVERGVANDLRPQPIAQPDILKPQQCDLSPLPLFTVP